MPRPAFVLPLALAAALLPATSTSARTLKPERSIETSEDFQGKKPGKEAKDVSGLACLPPVDGGRRCLLSNDENSNAQFAMLKGNSLSPGWTIALIGGRPSATTLGSPPAVPCPKQGGFGEFDGEGVAFAAPYFYVVGSHGCGRNTGEFRLSSFQLARIKLDGAGRQDGPAELTYRLSDALKLAGAAGVFFGRDLAAGDGMNVEGLAITGDRLWAGLRAPAPAGKAVLVGASLAELFAAGHEPLRGAPQVVSFDAGKGRGIRDLAALADGRLIALVGPRQDEDVPYALVLVDPARPEATRELGTLPDRKKAKAEVVTLLAETPNSLNLLVGYDGPKNGGFEEYRVPLR